jgi:ATP-dependent helicase/nuclease subunit A
MPPSGNADTRRAALLRGTLAHRLLQSLPEIPTDQREAAARRYLEGAGAKLPDDARAQLLVEVLTLMSDARFAPLFSPDSRSEVPLVGRITPPMREALLVTGQVDRLIVTENEVWIADYKTNRPAPRTLESVPRTYIRQLALYRLLLGRMYPAHIVRCALVWTEVPDLMEIPPVTMQQLLAAEGLA